MFRFFECECRKVADCRGNFQAAGSSDRTGKWNINFEGRNHNLLSQRHSDGIAPEAVRPGNMPRGCGQFEESSNPHTVLLSPAGHTVPGWLGERCLLKFGPECVLVTGANLIDCSGGAALLAGSPGAVAMARRLVPLRPKESGSLIAAGTEKLTSGNISSAVALSQRKHVSASHGMACGLLPLAGEVITELDAISMLAPVKSVLIGKGGIQGAEGGSLIQVWGRTEM